MIIPWWWKKEDLQNYLKSIKIKKIMPTLKYYEIICYYKREGVNYRFNTLGLSVDDCIFKFNKEVDYDFFISLSIKKIKYEKDK